MHMKARKGETAAPTALKKASRGARGQASLLTSSMEFWLNDPVMSQVTSKLICDRL
jgi:hypothetical protein